MPMISRQPPTVDGQLVTSGRLGILSSHASFCMPATLHGNVSSGPFRGMVPGQWDGIVFVCQCKSAALYLWNVVRELTSF